MPHKLICHPIQSSQHASYEYQGSLSLRLVTERHTAIVSQAVSWSVLYSSGQVEDLCHHPPHDVSAFITFIELDTQKDNLKRPAALGSRLEEVTNPSSPSDASPIRSAGHSSLLLSSAGRLVVLYRSVFGTADRTFLSPQYDVGMHISSHSMT